MTEKEIENQAEIDISLPYQTSLFEAYAMGARYAEREANEFLDSVQSDLIGAAMKQDWDAIEGIIDDIGRALKDERNDRQ